MSSAIDTTSVDTEKSGSARGAIAWVIVLILVAVYCLEFGLQTLLWIESRQWAADNPPLAEIPQPLPVSSSASAISAAGSKGTILKAYDYQFRVPWTGKWKQTPPMATTEFRFDSGQIVLMLDPDTQKEVLRGIRTSKSQDYLNFADVLAGQSVDSDYALFNAVYGAAPSQISPTMHQNDAQRIDLLLLWKLSFGADAQPGIYSFNFGANRGFQFGTPAPGRLVALRVFDDQERQLRLIFTTAAGSSAQFTQDDVNLAAQSLKSIPMLER
jgi:hypothetical protein